MPAKRQLTMGQLRQMLHPAKDGTSIQEIRRLTGVARSAVPDALKRAEAAGLRWPLPNELIDDVLEQTLFARAGVHAGTRRRQEPNWARLAVELKRLGVTLMLLWDKI